MTKYSHTLHIPADMLYPSERPRMILWLASYNLPPDAAYRVYRTWCDAVGETVSRADLDDLCGPEYNVT